MEELPKILRKDTIKDNVIKSEFAIRGPVIQRAFELGDKLKKGEKLPFTKFYPFHLGNPLALGQPAFTFFRETVAAALQPNLLKSESISKDARERAKFYIDSVEHPHAIGAYGGSQGYTFVRESIKKMLEARDGHPANLKDIFTHNGAAEGISNIMSIFIGSPKDAILLPFPHYPLYSATLSLHNGTAIPYYLDEKNDWNVDMKHLEESYKKAKADGYNVWAMIVNNPGNPCGQVFKADHLKEIVKFCYENRLLILADEVYQDNILGDIPFVSFKKTICDMGAPYNKTELVSFNTASKGFMAEGGLRGGYMELSNIDPFVQEQLVKIRSIPLCSNTVGQLMTELMCNPPKEGVNSHEVVELYNREKNMIDEGYKKRGRIMYERLNKMPRTSVSKLNGAMFCFPKFDLTESAIKAAKDKGVEPDVFLCLEALEECGLMMVPGTGFKQAPGGHFVRLTNLIYDMKEFEEALDALEGFLGRFFKKYP